MSFRVKAQQFGSKLSSMILPNLGAFMSWGILTAVGIFIQNDMLRSFISPMLTYLLPILIAFAGGRMVYDYRGGVVGSVATVGVIIGAEIPMLIGAMIMGPLAAWLLKLIDGAVEKHIPTGFELLINNLVSAILGATLAIVGLLLLAPAIESFTGVFSGGVDFLQKNGLLPFTAIFIEPAKVLFLNNAIGQGILTPLGTTQIADYGKSVLFLLESNPGPGLGILLAYMIFGKGSSKANAYGASVIHFLGGIHEIYFPFILMNPILVIAAIAGGITGTFLFNLFGVGLVGVASPGSILAILMMAATGDRIMITIAILASAAVSFAVSIPFVRRVQTDEDMQKSAQKMEELKGKKSRISHMFDSKEEFDYSKVKKIAYVCDAGLGSSLMGSTIIKKKISQAGLDDVEINHLAVPNLPAEVDLIVTHESLADRVREIQPGTKVIVINDYLNAPQYDELVENLKNSR